MAVFRNAANPVLLAHKTLFPCCHVAPPWRPRQPGGARPHPADPCSWTGVTCIGGRVTAIQVGNRSLAGTVPAEIRNLTGLLRLELHNNQLSGHLPSLAGLSSLQTLLLHGNSFSSVVPTDFFTGLSSLRSVFLDDNPFDPWVIPTSLKDAGALVNFSANSANGSGELPDFLVTAFPSLDNVALAFNLLFGPVPATFAAAPVIWRTGGRGGGWGWRTDAQNQTPRPRAWRASYPSLSLSPFFLPIVPPFD